MRHTRYVVAGGFAATLIAGMQWVFNGIVWNDAQALDLLQSIQQPSLYYGAAVATSAATILALMLTLLGLTGRSDTRFDRQVYESIQRVGLLSSITFCIAILLLLVLALPIGEFETLPDNFYPVVYNLIAGLNAALAGVLISAILMLYSTIGQVLGTFVPEKDEEQEA